MEALLESVSDAVSAMVLYSVEADESNAKVLDIAQGSAVVKAASDYLCDMAVKSADLWIKFNQPAMQKRMVDVASNLRQSVNEISQAASELEQSQYSKTAKKLLLKGAKGVMEHMVVLLQTADLYEVTRGIRSCARVTAKKKVLVSLGHGESFFVTAAQEFVTHTVETGKLIQKRIKDIDDYQLKKRLEECGEALRINTEPLLRFMTEYMRDAMNTQAQQDAQVASARLDEVVQETIVVFKLSAKSPFDLSMISDLDLKDDVDLRDAAMRVAGLMGVLQGAIQRGDAPAAKAALKALKIALGDQISTAQQLAKSCGDPGKLVQYENAIRAAQSIIDSDLPSFSKSIEELLRRPDNSTALNRLKALMGHIRDASNMMVSASSAYNADDLEELVDGMGLPIARLAQAVQRGDIADAAKYVTDVQQAARAQLLMADQISQGARPEHRDRLLQGVKALKMNIDRLVAALPDAAQRAAYEPANQHLYAMLDSVLQDLTYNGKQLVETVSVGTPHDLLMSHRALGNEYATLVSALDRTDRKAAQSALRQINDILTDELVYARAVARKTDNPLITEALNTLCANGQQRIADIISTLGRYSEESLDDPANQANRSNLDRAFADAELLSSQFVGAASRDFMLESGQKLRGHLDALVLSAQRGDYQASAAAIKSAVEEARMQAEAAELVAMSLSTTDPERAARIREYAQQLLSMGPTLVGSLKKVIAAPGDQAALGELSANAGAMGSMSDQLIRATTMDADEELMHAAALIDTEVRNMKDMVASGKMPNPAQMTNLAKLVMSQIKLANIVASKKGGAKNEGLIKASQLMADLIKNMVGAVRDGNLAGLESMLDTAAQLNASLVAARGKLEDDFETATAELKRHLDILEQRVPTQSQAQLQGAIRDVDGSLARATFLAHAIARQAEPERQKQIMAAVTELQGLYQALPPAIHAHKGRPADPALAARVTSLFGDIHASIATVANATTSSGEERLFARAAQIGQDLARLEDAVARNNQAEANAALQSAVAGIRVQAQLAKVQAEQIRDPAQRKAALEQIDRLEKFAATLSSAVKDTLAKPGDQAKRQKFLEALAATREAVAQVVAGSSSVLPEERVHDIAQAMQEEMQKLAAVLQRGNPQEIANALSRIQQYGLQQQADILRAYASSVSDPRVRRDALEAAAEFDRTLAELIPAIRAAQANPGDKAAIQKVLAGANDAERILGNICTIVTAHPESRLASLSHMIAEDTSLIRDGLSKKNAVEVNAGGLNAKRDTAHLVKAIRLTADGARSNPARRQQLLQLADRLDASIAGLAAAVRDSQSKPADAQAQRSALSAIELHLQSVGQASTLGHDQVAIFLEETALKLAGDAARVDIAFENKDAAGVASGARLLEGTGSYQVSLMHKALEGLPEERRAHATQVMQQIQKVYPQVVASSKDPKGHAQYKTSNLALQDALSQLIAIVNQAPEERIITLGAQMDREFDRLTASVKKGDVAGTESGAAAAVFVAAEQAVLARALARQASTPARAQELSSAAAELDKAARLLPRVALEAAAKPSDKAKQEAFAQAVNAMRVANRKLVANGQEERVVRERAEQERVRAEQERLEAERQARERAKQDEMASAALRVQESIKDVKVDNTVWGKLYGTARDIAQLMEQMSAMSAANDKRGMIETARQLAVQSATYVQQAKAAAEKCTDPKLKDQIMIHSQAAKNWAVQLKVITAVKAASDDDDASSTRAQLVKCAKSLAKEVVSCVDATKIAAIRSK
eukprot:TRINITY_DN1886_c0_g1_i4.p1 TRINITY_DN1886_c0_g1~~TRINITY_DN1886_c0_g1_i4.p1  ORF type:complete len:1752 (+),score=603.75 TRINITY_DN1886_c0_g1_i4:245-5500(+)